MICTYVYAFGSVPLSHSDGPGPQQYGVVHQSINQSIVLFPEQDAHMDCIEVYICISVRLHVSLHIERYISLVELHVDFVCTFR